MSDDWKRKYEALAEHARRCPIGYAEGRPITHRSTTDADVVAWLVELNRLVAP